MSTRRLHRLAPRLAIAFGTVVSIALLATALLTFSLVSRAAEARLARDMERAAEVISRFGSRLNAPLLHRLAEVLGSEVVVVDTTGEIVSGSLATTAWPAVEGALRAHLAAPDPEAPPFVITLPAGGYTTLLRPLEGDATRHWLALLRPAAEEVAWRRRIGIGLGAITLGALALVSLVGHLLALRITRPVETLAAATATLAAGDRPPAVETPAGGEVAELARAFNTMVARLEETERQRIAAERQAVAGRLAASVAHEVRNPLSSVRMLVQMVRDRLQGSHALEQEVTYTEVVLREIERVELVVQDLLDLAHPRPLDPHPCDLEAVVDEVAALMEAQLDHRGIRLTRTVAARPRIARVDADRVKQLLLNLLLNGADSMAEGGELTLETRWPPAAAAGRVEIRVRDTGHGVNTGEIETLFEPFRSGRAAGSGIGLSVSRQIARDHGGDLTLAPAEGGGTLATAWFPIG